MYFKRPLFTVLLLLPLISFSQASFYWEPDISYSWKSSDRWSYNIKATALTTISAEDNNGFRRTELSFFTTRKLFGGKSLSAGYQFRWAEPFFDEGLGYEHRSMQQIGFVSYLGERRIGHRFRAEQRFRRSGYINRFRYRLSYDFPLTGQELDPGEKYFIVSNEILFSINKERRGLDNRSYAALGWFFNSKRKLETGIQYRSEGIDNNVENVFHLITSFYVNR